MKFFTGLAMSAALACAASAANAQMAGSMRPISDFDAPYYGGLPPAAIPEPEPPAPRYYDRRYYGPEHYGPERSYQPGYDNRAYGGDDRYGRGYGSDYGYAPSLLSPHEVYAILRENGFSPLGAPRQRGYTYVIAVLDRGGEDGRLIIDGRSGRIIRFVPASQWGQAYDRMSYQTAPLRNLRGALPPPTVIRASPQAMPALPSVASRAAAPAQAAAPRPAAARPTEPPQRSAAVHDARPAPQTAGTVGEAKPAPQTAAAPALPAPAATPVKPTQDMPKVQGFE
jgi:hypothetical protein